MVISHTHWDREWYFPFEKFRIRLCDLINSLLDIIEKYPEYVFHLDAQCIVLEDYIEIYPEKEELLCNYINSGNIIVGPWYVQNDFFLSSGEATIRNIFIGRRIAEKFGKCANVGYTADQFGLISQLPQILTKMGIDKHMFGRGYTFYEAGKNDKKIPVDCEFYWEAPDGSKVFSVLLPYWYNNMQRISDDIDTALERLNKAEKNLSMWSNAPYYILMNGVDHLEAQDDIIPIMEKINFLLEDKKIYQTTMEEAIRKVESFASDKTVKGELRYGKELDVLTGTCSTRVDIKKLNYDIQNMTEHQVEPLYSMIVLLGGDNIYPQNEINYMWKTLIPNHAHDSICCCSNNNVMKHMQDRYLSIKEVGDELIERGCRFINHHIQRSEENNGEYYLTVVNTFQMAYTGVIDISIDINIAEDKGSFRIISPDGEEIPFVINKRENKWHATFSSLNLPGRIEVISYKVQIFVKDVPSFGYTNYSIIPTESTDDVIVLDYNVLENDYLKVDFEGNRINLEDKINNIYFVDVLNFDDVGDNGDSYTFIPFEADTPIKAELTEIKTIYANKLKSEVSLTYVMNVPYEKNENGRCGQIVQNKITVLLSLGKCDKFLNVKVVIDNNSKYHWLRAVVNTGICNNLTYASSVYDVIERDDSMIDERLRNHTQPVNGFVYKKNSKFGFAIYTKGLYEYENSEKEIVRLSLLRSTDVISDIDYRKWGNSDNLMIGQTEVSFALMPFNGDDSTIAAYEQNVAYQPLYWCDSTDIRMFTGGRPAVQDGDVDKLYFKKDTYEKLNLPHTKELLQVSENVCVSALKKAESNKKIVLRIYNPQDESVNDVIKTDKQMIITDMQEKAMNVFENKVSGKEIATIYID